MTEIDALKGSIRAVLASKGSASDRGSAVTTMPPLPPQPPPLGKHRPGKPPAPPPPPRGDDFVRCCSLSVLQSKLLVPSQIVLDHSQLVIVATLT